MAITNSQRLKELRKKREEENKKSSSSNSPTNSQRARKLGYERTIKLDTLESDLKSMGKTVQSIYDGWQTEETMKNTRSAVESMYNRLTSYQDYQKQYGGADVTDLVNSYKSVLDGWDDRTKLYGGFKNADAYNVQKKRWDLGSKFRVKTGTNKETGEDEYRGLTYDEVQKELKKYKPDSDEYKFLSTYTGYENLDDFDKAIENTKPLEHPEWYENVKNFYDNWNIPNAGEWNEKKTKETGVISYYTTADQKKAEQEREEYFKEFSGGKTLAEFEHDFALAQKNSHLEELKRKKNVWELDNAFDSLDDIMSSEDFEENSQYVSTKKKGLFGTDDYEDYTYEFINDVDGGRNFVISMTKQGNSATKYEQLGYDKLTNDEKRVYNYWYDYDKKNGTNKANEFLKDMEITLTKRVYDDSTKMWDEMTDNPLAATGLNLLTPITNISGGIGNIIASTEEKIKGKEYNPYSPLRTFGNFTSDIRKYTSEDIEKATEGFDFLGQNIPTFLYQTAMSMGDTALGGAGLGAGYSVIAGSSAFQQKAKEMKEAGESDEVVFKTALASGAAEMVFEYISLDKLIKIGSVDEGKKIITEALKQAGIEASEEFATELANIYFDDAIRGTNSELAQLTQDLRIRGYSESEIKNKLALKVTGQLGWAAAGGFLSGLGMGTGASAKSYLSNRSLGKDIKANERTGDMLNVASLTPQESAAYEAYNEYVGKGVNANNITNAQLGNLYALTNEDAQSTLNSKKSTLEQKRNATETLKKLSVIDEKNTVSKDTIKSIDRNISAREGYMESANELIATGLESGEDTKSYKLATEYKQKLDNGEQLTEKEIANLVKANSEAITNEDVATLSEEDATLFKSIYDGKTDKGDFLNSFNLVTGYAENNFSPDYILEHKGVLTEKQVAEIYKAKVLNNDKSLQSAIDNLKQKHEGTPFIEGTFNDSVINYENTKVDGKVNWNSLKPSQKKAIAILGQVGKGIGMDVELISDGLERGINGAFEISGNKMLIDIYAGMDKIDGSKLKDTIIPTTSHEMTHWMQNKSPELYRKYDQYVFDTLKMSGQTEDEILASRRKKMETAHPSITYTDAEVRDEVIARASEDMFAKSEEIKKFLNSLTENEKKSFVDKVKEILNNIKEWLSDFLSTQKSNSDEAKIIRKYQDRIDEQIKLWDKMLVSSISANQALKKEGITGETLAKVNKLQFNERLVEKHLDLLEKNYSEESALPLDTILTRYNKVIEMWRKLGGELNSQFLEDWNNKVGTDRTFSVFKAQAGYKYNVELSSMCKKGIPLFEAIDKIVKDEAMKELRTKTLGKAEKEILYDILKENNFEIPCAICYVEQARQSEGKIIDAFLNGFVEKSPTGKTLQFKLGWNETLDNIQKEMHDAGFDYTFPSLDRSVATDNYTPADLTMDEETQEHFFEALKKVANKEIRRYNKEQNKGKPKKLITKTDAKSINEVFKGKLPLNLMMFKTLFNEPSSRFKVDGDLLYSSMTTQNIAANHNGFYSIFNAQGGVGGYKTKQGTIVYWADILGKKWTPSKLRNEGGVRNQSNSDFLMYTMLDHAQMYVDFTAKGYYLQAYTKVLAELKLFGLSKGKINASFIPKVEIYRNADGSIDVAKTQENAGLDKQGNPIYDDIEGINHKEAFMLIEDAEYSKSIGGVCIGYSDKHILKLLDDNRIQLVIGFHDKTNDTSKRYKGAVYSKNYNGINEATKYDKDGKLKTVHIGFNQFIRKAENKFKSKDTIEYNGKTYKYNDIPKLATDLYLEHCESKGLFPAYSQGGTDFSKHTNYYKLLADFSLYDINGNYAPHQKVEFNMPNQVPYLDKNGNKAYESTEKYVKKELEKELIVRDDISAKLADKSENGIIPQFIQRANALYENTKFSDRDSVGNTLSKEQVEFFKDSLARDKNGNLLLLYHGTDKAGFTIFDTRLGKFGGNWFTTSRIDADSYAGNYKHKLFNPNEKDDIHTSVGGNFNLNAEMRFDSEEDLEKFKNDNPNYESYLTDEQIVEQLEKAEENDDWDEYDRLENYQYSNERKSIQRAYLRYEWEHSRTATIGELLDNPSQFSINDIIRAYDSWDTNNAVRDAIQDGATKEELLSGFISHENEIEDESESIRDLTFKARLNPNESGTVENFANNRTYACYLNVTNPYIINANNRTLHGANLYGTIENAMKDSHYDGVIIRNARVGAHEELGDVVIIKESNQVKLANNEKPTSNPDIRYSDREKVIPTGFKLPEGTKVNKNGKPYSAQAQRDAGYMLSEDKFYQLYSAHKLTYGNRGGDIKSVIEKIKKDGFISSTSIANVLPTSTMRHFDYDANGKPKFNIVQFKYAHKKGDYVLFVPNNQITRDDIIKNGFKPLDYEIVKVEYDYQPYYDMYTKAYEQAYEQIRNDQVIYMDRENKPILDSRIEYTHRADQFEYNNLVNKVDMPITIVDEQIPNNRADIIHNAKKNAASVGKTNKNGSVSVYVEDIGVDVLLGTDGLKHGLRRVKNSQENPNFIVTLKAGEIIKNSIKINEMLPTKEGAKMSYVLLGAASNTNGDLYIVRSIVNKFNNELSSIDVLYAINTKKEMAVTKSPRFTDKPLSDTISNISISNLLDYVNKYFPDVLPESVLKHYEHTERPKGDFDKDVLFSDRDNVSVYDKMGETDRLIKENEQLKADVERLKERLKIERQVTNGNYFNENQLNAVAGHIRNIANSNYNKKDLVTLLNGIYQYIAHSPDLNWQDLFAQCYDVASMVLDEARPITETNEYYKSILKNIRGTRISVNEQQVQNAKYRLGNKWRNAFFNKVTITEGATSLDRHWQEWSAEYPNIFDAGISDADMLVELYDIYDSVREGSEMIVEYDMEEQTRWLAREIYNQYWNVSPIRTTADKYDKQIKRLNFEHRKTMQEFRDKYEEKLKTQHKVDKQKAQELIQKVRERKNEEIAQVKQRSKERMDAYRENAERKTKIQIITANALNLNKLLTTNSKDYHINETLKPVVVNLLQAIDFSSKQMLNHNIPTQKDISLYKALEEVKNMFINANNETALSDLTEFYGIDMDDEITELLRASFEVLTEFGDNGFILNEMSLADLKTLDKVVRTIKQVVNKLNKFHIANHYKGVIDLGHNSVKDFDKLGQAKVYDQKSLKGGIKRLLNWGNLTPYYAFKKFGKGGKVMFEALQDGWDKLSYNIKSIMDFTKTAYTNDEVREWSQEIKDIKVHDIITDKDVTVRITVAQAMSLYCSLKREQARGHILGDGIRITDISVKKGKVISQPDGVRLSLQDTMALTDILTKRQIQVADKLQEFMNTTCADWGNEISMARFGYKAFGEPNYFPISSDKNNLAVDDAKEENNSLFRLLNMSFTKSTVKGANNKIEIKDIFDVFAQHTSDMAKYNSLALPVLDFYKWYNYTEKGFVDGEKRTIASLKASMEKAFGKDAKEYVTNFLKDINGQYDVSRDSIGKGFFKNAKIASVGMNLRVVLLQPTSYVRASAVINNKYLTKALLHKPKMNKATEHCGMALWKSLGYYDTNISRGVTQQIKHDENWKDKAVEWSMKGAEVADKLTWGYLWNACELEIRETRKDLKVGSNEFYETIGKRLREVIYATQVVDSTMTRSQMMRSPSMYDKMLTSFASEPTLAYSMLYDAIETASLEKRANGKVSKETVRKMAKVMIAYTMTNAVAALVESGFDAFRDEDDEEMDLAEFMKLYLSNFAFDMSVTAKIPYIKEFVSILQGFSTSRTDTQWMQSIGYALKGWTKVIVGDGNPTSAIKNSLRSLAYLTGLPFYNAYRDTMATLNKLDILTAEELEELLEDLFS